MKDQRIVMNTSKQQSIVPTSDLSDFSLAMSWLYFLDNFHCFPLLLKLDNNIQQNGYKCTENLPVVL